MSFLNSLALDTKRVTNEGLKRLNLLAGGLYLLQAVAVFLITSSDKGQNSIYTGLLSKDQISSDGGRQMLVHATQHLFNLNTVYVIALSLLIAAGGHVLLATRRRKYYETDLKNSINSFRWVEMIFTVGLLAVALALSLGVAEVSLLVLVFIGLATYFLSALSGELDRLSSGSKWNSRIGLVAFLGGLAVTLIYLIASAVYGNPPNLYVYLAAILFSAYLLTIYFQNFSKVNKKISTPKYLMNERNHILVSFVAKSAVAWALVLAINI